MRWRGYRELTAADIKDTNYAFSRAALGPRYQGTPAYISQADILQPITPIINARSDTFLIRTYGEALAKDGTTVLAKAWCEAVVQRYPEYLNPQDMPETPVINATPHEVAIKFGSAAPVRISPKKAALLHDPAAGNALTLPVVIQQKDGEEWKPVTTENWPHDTRFRNFLSLYTSSRDHHMAFHGITQRVE